MALEQQEEGNDDFKSGHNLYCTKRSWRMFKMIAGYFDNYDEALAFMVETTAPIIIEKLARGGYSEIRVSAASE